MRSSTALIILAWVALMPAGASADKSVAKAQKNRSLTDVLDGLEWGATSRKVLEHHEKAVWKDYKEEKKRLSDTYRIDKLREATQARVAQVRKSLVKLERGGDEYQVSIIDSEFKRGTGEMVLRIDEKDGQKYWFFIQEQLWKVVMAYEPAAVEGMDVYAVGDQVAARYGKPGGPAGEEAPGDMNPDLWWADEATDVRVSDRLDPYGTFAISWQSRELTARLPEMRGDIAGLGGPGAVDPGDALLDDIMTDAEDDTNADIIDQITGVSPTGASQAAVERAKPKKAAQKPSETDPGKAAKKAAGDDDADDEDTIIY